MPANNTAAVRAGRAFIELFVEDGQLEVGLRSAQRRMRQFAGTVRTMGASMLSGGILANFGLGVASKVFADFEDQMSIVRGIVADTETDFMGLREEITRLGRETSFTARQVASAAVELTRGGLSGAQTKAALANTLALARGGNVELAEAARTIVTSLSQFNLRADQAGIAADVLAKAANASASDVTDLAEALKFAGVTGALIGEDIYSVAAGLALLANAGVRGTLAGTQLGRAYKELSVGLKQQKIWDELGVKVTNFQGNMRATAEVMADIRDAMDARKWSQGRRLSFLGEVFGRGINAAAILGASRAEFEKMKKTLQESDGYAARLAATMDDNLGGSFRLLMSAVEGVAIAIGESLNDAMRKFAASLTTIGVLISEWIERNKEWVAAVGKAVALMIPLGVALLAFAAALRITAGLADMLFKTIQFGVGVGQKLYDVAKWAAKGWTDFAAAAGKASAALRNLYTSMKTTQAAATQTQRLLTQVIYAPAPSRKLLPGPMAGAPAAAKAAEAGAKASKRAAAAVRTVSDTTSKAARNAMVAVQAAARVVEGEWIGDILYSASQFRDAFAQKISPAITQVKKNILSLADASGKASQKMIANTSRVAGLLTQVVNLSDRSGKTQLRLGVDRSLNRSLVLYKDSLTNAARASRGFISSTNPLGLQFAKLRMDILRLADTTQKFVRQGLGKRLKASFDLKKSMPDLSTVAKKQGELMQRQLAGGFDTPRRSIWRRAGSKTASGLVQGMKDSVKQVERLIGDIFNTVRLPQGVQRGLVPYTPPVDTRVYAELLSASGDVLGKVEANTQRSSGRVRGLFGNMADAARRAGESMRTFGSTLGASLSGRLGKVGTAARNAAKAMGPMLAGAAAQASRASVAAGRAVMAFGEASSKAAGKIWSGLGQALLGIGKFAAKAAAGGIKMLLGGIYSIVAGAAKGAVAVTAMAASFLLLGLKAVIAGGAIAALVYGIAKLTGTDKALMDGLGKGLEFIKDAALATADAVIGAMGQMFDYIEGSMERAAKLRDKSFMPEFDRDRKLLQYLEDLSKKSQMTASEFQSAQAAIAALSGKYSGVMLAIEQSTDKQGRVFWEMVEGVDAFQKAFDTIGATELISITKALEEVQAKITELTKTFAETDPTDSNNLARLGDEIDKQLAQEEKLLKRQEELKKRQAELGKLDPNDPIAVKRREELAINDRNRQILDDFENERINALERLRGAVEDAPVKLDRAGIQSRVDKQLEGVTDPEGERRRAEAAAEAELKTLRKKTLKEIEKEEKRAAEEIAALRGQGVADDEIIARELQLQEELNDIRLDKLEEFNRQRLEIEAKTVDKIASIYEEMEQKRKEMEDEIAEQQKVLSNTAGTFSGRLIAQIGGSGVNKSILNEAKNTNRILSRMENKMGAGGFMIGAN